MMVAIPNLVIAVIYLIVVSLLYSIINSKFFRELRSKKGIPHGASHELEVIVKWTYLVFALSGFLIALVSTEMLVLLLIVSLVIMAIIAKDIIESVIYYHFLVANKVITYGEYVMMARGIRGWVRRLNPLYTELSGEQGEVIRVPNKLVATEPIRIPAKALPLTVVIKVYLEKDMDLEEISKTVQEVVAFTRRHAIAPPRLRIRSVGSNHIEYEVTYGISNPETSNTIIKKLAQRLRQMLKDEVRFEIKREYSIIK